MRISFDLDDTLVCPTRLAPAEPSRLRRIFRRWLSDALRRGTRTLMRELRRRGCSIWIYTTSGRTPIRIRIWLYLHGIHVDGVVNSERHREELSDHNLSHVPSKYPPAFGINLHVDDSEGVRMEGEEHGFHVVVVRPDDEHWTQKVLDAVHRRNSPELALQK